MHEITTKINPRTKTKNISYMDAACEVGGGGGGSDRCRGWFLTPDFSCLSGYTQLLGASCHAYLVCLLYRAIGRDELTVDLTCIPLNN